MAKEYIPDSKVIAFLEEELDRARSPDGPQLLIHNNRYSMRQLLIEAKAGTPLGRRLILYLEEFLEPSREGKTS